MSNEPTRFDRFYWRFKDDPDRFRDDLKGDGAYDYIGQVKNLERLQGHFSARMALYMFGEHPGEHLWDKFAKQCSRNLLYFLSQLTAEYRMFILYELKNNESLFAYS